MSFTADLHLHSPYAMGVSRAMSLETLAWWAGVKGLDVLACGDFTHPAWLAELHRKLHPAGDGLFALRADGASSPAGRAVVGEGAEGSVGSSGEWSVGAARGRRAGSGGAGAGWRGRGRGAASGGASVVWGERGGGGAAPRGNGGRGAVRSGD